MVDINIVILTFNTKDTTLNCLRSIFQNKSRVRYKVYVVDNGSEDGTHEAIKTKYPEVDLIQNQSNLGFANGNNLALKRIYKNAFYTLLLNSDTVIKPGSLESLFNFAEKNDFGIITCKLLNPDLTFQPNAGDLPRPIPMFLWLSQMDGVLRFLNPPSFHQNKSWYYKNGNEVGWVSGAVMMVKRDVFNKIGFLDDRIFMYGEDADYCWRASKKGIRIGWTDEAEIIHLGGASSKSPKFSQWRGEFMGLLFLYEKYYGSVAKFFLKLLIYFFNFLRIFAFLIAKKPDYARTYAKIITSI